MCVCVWPARAVIEPICRLAPVGLNPGLTALRWLNAFAMFLKPILFLFLPSSLDNLPSPPPPHHHLYSNRAPRTNTFFIEIDALSFHRVGGPRECVLHIFVLRSVTWQIYVPQKKKRKLVKCWGHVLCCP